MGPRPQWLGHHMCTPWPLPLPQMQAHTIVWPVIASVKTHLKQQ